MTASSEGPRTRLDQMPLLRAGAWSARLDGAGVRDLRWHGLDVATRVHVALRDARWGTPPVTLDACEVTTDDHSFRIDWKGRHDDAGAPFRWRGSLDARADGTMRLEVTGTAGDSIDVQRFGPVVLLSPRWAGATWRVQHDDDPAITGRLPHLIGPQPVTWTTDGTAVLAPLVPAHTIATFAQPGLALDLTWQGDVAEVEDQRNWADASFKLYTGRVADSTPLHLRADDTLSRSLDLRVATATSPSISVSTPHVASAPHPQPGPPARVTVTVDLCDPDWPQLLHAWLTHSPTLDLHLVGDLDHDWTSALTTLRTLIGTARLASLWAHPRAHTSGTPGECTPPALMATLRAAVQDADLAVDTLGGGSRTWFTELVRHPLDHLAAVCFGVDPTVHADDLTSMLETPQTAVAMADTLAEVAPAAVVHWGPVGRADLHAAPLPDTWWTSYLGAVCAVGPAVLVVARHDALVDEFARHAGRPCWNASPPTPLTTSVIVWHHDDHLEMVATDLTGVGSSVDLDLGDSTVETWTNGRWLARAAATDRLDLGADEIVRVRLRRGVDSPRPCA